MRHLISLPAGTMTRKFCGRPRATVATVLSVVAVAVLTLGTTGPASADVAPAMRVANISSGETLPIRRVVDALAAAADWHGEVVWERNKPVGVPERAVSAAVLQRTGFRCRHTIEDGIRLTWDWFERHAETARS